MITVNEDGTRSCFFNPQLAPKSPEFQQYTANLGRTIVSPLAMRADGKAKLLALTNIVLANLASMVRQEADSLIIPLSARVLNNSPTYKNTPVNYPRTKLILDLLQKHGVIQVQLGSSKRSAHYVPKTGRKGVAGLKDLEEARSWTMTATRVRLTEEYLPDMQDVDIELRPGTTIILKAEKPKGKLEKAQHLPVVETVETDRMDQEIKAINLHMTRFPMVYQGRAYFDTSLNHVTRTFNNASYEHGGRLFGHWAQTCPKSMRHNLRLPSDKYPEGEPIVDLDFGSMHISLLHNGIEKIPVPEEDPFAIPGGFDRDLVKKASYAILNAERPLVQPPLNIRGLMPADRKWPELRDLALEHVPLLDKYKYSGMGLRLMNQESTILVRCLLNLTGAEIAFVPMHDGIMVPESQEDLARYLMTEAYFAETGFMVSIKATHYPANDNQPVAASVAA